MGRHISAANASFFSNLESPPDKIKQVSSFDVITVNKTYVNDLKSSLQSPGYIYKSSIEKLNYIPLYSLIAGVPNIKFNALTRSRSGVPNFIGSSNFGFGFIQGLRFRTPHSMGYRTQRMYSNLASNTYVYNNIDKSLMVAPFCYNTNLIDTPEENFPKLIEKIIDDIVTLPEIFYTVHRGKTEKGTYNELFNDLCKSSSFVIGKTFYEFRDWQFKSGIISSTFGTVVDFTNKKVLAMLTLNPEYIDYYLLHKYSGTKKKLHQGIFKLVLDKDFTKNTDKVYAKELFTLVRKGIIEVLDPEVGVDYIDGSDLFNSLYATKIDLRPSKLNPLEQVEKNQKLQEDFLTATNINNNLRVKKIFITE
jgi:hypothetical protein